ncbi:MULTISPECIES: site-specific recombinase [unclassified Polaromonas]|jgi:site-specific recombinase|uniref:site-specific recombinase n=1 Tax=unclassified Polaromonas TaxID=2638319 RepID=UPI000BDA3AC3|nr:MULTISPECIES: site-specific recombinase [unclassified Polaromonas]OYY32241.1 MAG: recombinase [Polaromonas sp. 35-63-35]OYZ20788.1 MAG: recombinase [Polaromonas sp. 16-63-31]OYZ78381.1 MAG: recombinase [Polaromonas sp. 24-63-21]OZA49186.1 MAG: recombinase [Polaromonas sp. 17-63-33]OZA85938.1 MAG: recombinase [Polaromonas sp. 39-63-25]
MRTLSELLDQLEPRAELAVRHLWLSDLLDWIRGDASNAQAALSRVGLFLDAAQARPGFPERLRLWWLTLVETVDATPLFADFGFAPRAAFLSELGERLRYKLLPGTPETTHATELFMLLFPVPFDAQWLKLLDEGTLGRLGALLDPPIAAPAGDEAPVEPFAPAASTLPQDWQITLLDSLTYCTSQVCATGFAPELRLRMSPQSLLARPFHGLQTDLEALRAALLLHGPDSGALHLTLDQFKSRLEACRSAASSVYAHLDEHGISVGLVFRLRQLRERILRIRELLDCLLSDKPATSAMQLLARLVLLAEERRSIRALVASNSTLLAAKVAERGAETGEHYITRDRAAYTNMLGTAAGGGAVTAITTLLKFMVVGLALSAFWSGFLASIVYAASFVLIQLLHFTLATKQPAMTAPAMAAKLKDLRTGEAVSEFVDEVTHLVRSQVAAVLGNVLVVVPVVLLISLAMQYALGQPMIDAKEAGHVLHTLSLFGPTLLWAAFTGVVLFVASIIGGWVENWFVLYHLASAMRYNPRITRALGVVRARRWAHFMRDNISGFTSNIALGFMLGLIPPMTGFFGLELEVRHVTLSSGQLAAAAAALGWDALRQPALWWCVASIPLIGALNLGVSFYFAFRLALRAHSVSGVDRRRIRSAIWARWRSKPASFFLPD